MGGWAALALASDACLGQTIVTTRVGPPGFAVGGVDVRVGPFVPPPVYVPAPAPIFVPAPRVVVPPRVVVVPPAIPAPAPVRVISSAERDELRFQDAYNRLSSRHDNSRRDGAQILGQLGDLRAVPMLCELLLNDDDASVRQACARSLGQLGDHRALPMLRQAAARDRKDKVRNSAIWAYQQIESGIGSVRVEAPATLGAQAYSRTEPGIVYESTPAPSSLEPAPAPRTSAPSLTAPSMSVPPPPPAPADDLGPL